MPDFLVLNAFEWGVFALVLVLIFGILYLGSMAKALARRGQPEDSADSSEKTSES